LRSSDSRAQRDDTGDCDDLRELSAHRGALGSQDHHGVTARSGERPRHAGDGGFEVARGAVLNRRERL
jgi:hypothetical protein